MLCNIKDSPLSLKEIIGVLNKVGEEIGVSIHVQHEDIFNAMHKI
jgi:ACT domain-containing protein